MALPNKTKIPVGTVLAGKYRITREIGRGGMAAVYEAENIDIGKRVAIKVLAQELTASVIVVERFLREARAAAAIRSPYICDVYDSGKLDDGRPFLVLELLEGESLYERMTKIRFLDTDTTIAVITQTCRGLTKAHAASIVHRDLKPENIFLTKDEEGKLLAKILDFGLAKFYAPVAGSEQQARLTREGAVFGTPAYMSPEQVRGQGAVDQRADLWALGCIVYECLTGRTVWSTEQGVAMTFAQIANAPLPNPQHYRSDLPDAFGAWFNKALDRNIERRFQTAKEFAEELASTFQQGRPSFSGIMPLSSLVTVGDVLAAESARNPFLPSLKKQADDPGAEVPIELRDPLPQSQRRAAPQASPSGSGGPPIDAPPTSARASKLGFVAPESVDTQIPGLPTGRRSRPLSRAVVVGVALAVLVGAGYAGWTQFIETPKTPLVQNSASPSGTALVPTSPTASAQPAAALPWVAPIRDAQQAIAAGDFKSAAKLLKDAFDRSGGHGVPRTLSEDLSVALSGGNERSPCRLGGLARPRIYDLSSTQVRATNAGRPSIAVGPRGVVMAWTDAHEGSEHAYTAALDEAMRTVGVPVDVTPEGAQIVRPELERADDKLVVAYADVKGPEAGIKVRFLEADGHIGGPPVAVSPATKGSSSSPSLVRAPDGSFFVAWSHAGDNDSEEIYLRRLAATLEPQGDVVRATDFVPQGPTRPRAHVPSIGVASGAIELAFKLERDPYRLIQQIRLPLSDASKGLEPEKKGARRVDRTVGELSLVNTDKAKADSPSIACGAVGCFLAWHGEQNGGAWAAFVDPARGQVLWRKRFSKAGARPAVAVGATGQAQLIWYEAGKVLSASINRDGVVGPSAKIARISGDQPPPSIVAGLKPGEWLTAWLDYEAGHLEAYGARMLCK